MSGVCSPSPHFTAYFPFLSQTQSAPTPRFAGSFTTSSSVLTGPQHCLWIIPPPPPASPKSSRILKCGGGLAICQTPLGPAVTGTFAPGDVSPCAHFASSITFADNLNPLVIGVIATAFITRIVTEHESCEPGAVVITASTKSPTLPPVSAAISWSRCDTGGGPAAAVQPAAPETPAPAGAPAVNFVTWEIVFVSVPCVSC